MTTNPKEKDMRVLVAYEDFVAGNRAMAMLKRIGRQCAGPGRLIHMMWRFDVLSDSSFSELAVSEALAADIIVIAAREGKGLPKKVRHWIARWFLMKEDRPLALVATLDQNWAHAGSQQYILTFLAKLAHCGKMQFFNNGSGHAAGVDLAKIKTNAVPPPDTAPGEDFVHGQ